MEEKLQEEEPQRMTGAEILASLAPYLTQVGIAILAFLVLEVWGDTKQTKNDVGEIKLEQAREFSKINARLDHLERDVNNNRTSLNEHEKRLDQIE